MRLLALLFGMTTLIAVCLIIILLHGWRADSKRNMAPLVSTAQEKRIADCKKESLNQLELKSIGIQILNEVQSLCFARIGEEDELSEYGTRRNAYLIQQSETTVLMWMVVIITISGVVLAAIQLIASFKFAAAGKANLGQETNINIEAHKLSISSSVSGILILVVSLCFFYVFTMQIYSIRDDEQKRSITPPALINSDLQPGPAAASQKGTLLPDKAVKPVDEQVKRLGDAQKAPNDPHR